MEPDQIAYRPAIQGLAYAAEASVEECLQHGATWTLLRMLERRLAVVSIKVVRRLGGGGLAYGKGLVGLATRERVKALGEAIDREDAEAAVAVLDQWMVREHTENERLVRGIFQAFGHDSPARADE